MIKRRTFVSSLAAAAAGAVALPAFAQSKEKVVLLLNWYLYSEHAPFFLGREMGFFDQEGIDLEIQEGRGAGVTIQAVAAGSAPFGYSDVPVATLEPNHIIDHFDELTPELVERLLAVA